MHDVSASKRGISQRETGKDGIQQQGKEWLQWHGWFVFKNHQSLGSYKGVADLYAIKGGVSVWVEVKTPDGVLSKHQRQFQADIEAHGGEYVVARSMEDIEREIRERGL